MAKQGMKRPEHPHKRNEHPPVPQLQGKAKTGKETANPIIAGTQSPSLKVYHSRPHKSDKPISEAYAEIDTDLARDNLENDLTMADRQDL